jgi:hypothetical protein
VVFVASVVATCVDITKNLPSVRNGIGIRFCLLEAAPLFSQQPESECPWPRGKCSQGRTWEEGPRLHKRSAEDGEVTLNVRVAPNLDGTGVSPKQETLQRPTRQHNRDLTEPANGSGDKRSDERRTFDQLKGMSRHLRESSNGFWRCFCSAPHPNQALMDKGRCTSGSRRK